MICRTCGKELSDQARFCTGCGMATAPVASIPKGPAPLTEVSPRRSSVLADLSFTLGLLSLLLMTVPLSFALMGFVPLVFIWSGVFGVLIGPATLLFLALLSLCGLVLGVVSLIVDRTKNRKKRFAVWGICLSAASLFAAIGAVLLAVLSFLMLPITFLVSYCAALAGATFVVLLVIFGFAALGGML